MVLVMTVEPGFGGQAFMEDQLDTIRRVRAIIEKYNPACELEVDGGIDPVTARTAVENGAAGRSCPARRACRPPGAICIGVK